MRTPESTSTPATAWWTAIKPLARATRRPGADAELGGFGGLFDLKAAGFADPILVAANDGVGTKVKIAIESGIFDTIGIDLVAMCVNDIVVQGAEPLLFLDYFAAGKLDEKVAAAVVKGIAGAARNPAARSSAARRPRCRASTPTATSISRALQSARPSAARCCPRGGLKAGDAVFGLPSSGVHSNGFSLVRRIVSAFRPRWDEPAPFEPARSLAEALLTPTRLYVRPLLEVLRRTAGVLRARPHHRRRLSRTICRACCRTGSRSGSTSPPSRRRRSSPGWRRWAACRRREMLRTFNCGFGMAAFVAAARESETREALERAGLGRS